MYNHTNGAFVAAKRPTTGRAELRDRGMQFFRVFREAIGKSAHACEQLPTPSHLFNDIARERPATLITFGQALAALADDPTLPAHAIDEIFIELAGVVRSWRPTITPCVESAFRAETRAQADADDAQVVAMIGLQRNDRVGLQFAIEHTVRDIAAGQVLLASLHRALARVDATPTHRVQFRRAIAAAGVE